MTTAPTCVRRRGLRVAVAAALLALLGACGQKPAPGPARPDRHTLPGVGEVRTGDCADPERDGALGEHPALRHADRDLDGDGRDELVVADGNLCTPEGNCHWNLFRDDDGCRRYLGTVSAARVQRMSYRGESGFVDLRAMWHLTGERRWLLQTFRFRRGGYHLAEVLVCRQSDDNRVLCAEEEDSTER
ncbi:hypothetical protein [Haliangium sp.]|uniref:hypothetical protein n=1 Tax=Haliangium sp. TaxID=2663208 RepID=UPI003D0CB6EA